MLQLIDSRLFGGHRGCLSRRVAAKAFVQERTQLVICHLYLPCHDESLPVTCAEQNRQAIPICPKVLTRSWRWDVTLERFRECVPDGQVITCRDTNCNGFEGLLYAHSTI